jgi:hypothetical protein
MSSRPALKPTQPLIKWVTEGGFFPTGLKQRVREADHSPPTISEGKKTRISAYTPPYAFMAQCLVKHSDNFTFLYCVGMGNRCHDVPIESYGEVLAHTQRLTDGKVTSRVYFRSKESRPKVLLDIYVGLGII